MTACHVNSAVGIAFGLVQNITYRYWVGVLYSQSTRPIFLKVYSQSTRPKSMAQKCTIFPITTFGLFHIPKTNQHEHLASQFDPCNFHGSKPSMPGRLISQRDHPSGLI